VVLSNERGLIKWTWSYQMNVVLSNERGLIKWTWSYQMNVVFSNDLVSIVMEPIIADFLLPTVAWFSEDHVYTPSGLWCVCWNVNTYTVWFFEILRSIKNVGKHWYRLLASLTSQKTSLKMHAGKCTTKCWKITLNWLKQTNKNPFYSNFQMQM